jgi:hypothetical protein
VGDAWWDEKGVAPMRREFGDVMLAERRGFSANI